MSFLALCNRRTILFKIAAAADRAGLNWRLPQTDPTLFLETVRTGQPRFVLITETYLTEPGLLDAIRQANPEAVIVVCLTPEAKTDIAFWHSIEGLDFDTLCRLDELPTCLQALNSGRYFESQLLEERSATHHNVPGLNELSLAERRVLRGMVDHKTGPQIADWLCLSEKTVNNHKAKIAQKVGVMGGPGSLTRFVLLRREQIAAFLAGISD
jgi:DNA-binding NarL/FixJ family response regulator